MYPENYRQLSLFYSIQDDVKLGRLIYFIGGHLSQERLLKIQFLDSQKKLLSEIREVFKLLDSLDLVDEYDIRESAEFFSIKSEEFVENFILDNTYELSDLVEVLKKFCMKCSLLKEILNECLREKRVVFSRQHGLRIEIEPFSVFSQFLPTTSLSSGEKHLVKIFGQILLGHQNVDFENCIYLIDEPEISLHIEWQLKFIHFLNLIVESTQCQFIISTHSPSIINGNWHLVRELS